MAATDRQRLSANPDMEAALGFLSNIYPTSDNLLHGDLAQIGSLLSTLNSATPLRLRMTRDGY